jgi:hypothetical protein
MKKVYHEYDNKYIKIYMGYYDKTILVVSKDKDLVRDYLTQTRKLKPTQFNIVTQTIEMSYFYIHYEDYIINDFYNLSIPLIDIKIIEREYGELDKELVSTINRLKYVSFLINNIKNTEEELNNIISTIKILEEYNKEDTKKNKKINKSHMMSHPILSCNINEYFQLMNIYKEERQMLENYKYMCYKDL